MATILAYTSPALGHLFPFSALLRNWQAAATRSICARYPRVWQMGRKLGFTTDAIDPRIEAMVHEDWKASNPRAALKMAVDVFCRRAAYEVADFTDAITRTRPDALLVDINCWGAMSVADAGDIPWACFSPYTPPLQSHGVPPFGLGLAPLPGMLGRVRDAALRPIVMGMIERAVLPLGNSIRASAGAPPVASADEFMRRAPLMLVASGKPFEYPQTNWGDAVQMIGPCMFEPAMDAVPDWLKAIDRPIVLVTTSSQKQADAKLVSRSDDRARRRAGTCGRDATCRAAKRRHSHTERDGARIRAARTRIGPRGVCGNTRRHGRDPKGPCPWRSGMRGAVWA